MSSTNRYVKDSTKGASRRQYADIVRRKERKLSDEVVAVGAIRSDAEVTRRGFSRGARMWHKFTDGGEPVCDVCKRVGHVAKSCWRRKKTSLSSRRAGCGRDDAAGLVVHSIVKKQEGFATAERHMAVSVDGQQVQALLDFNALENAVSLETVLVDPKLKIYSFQDERRASSEWKVGALGMVWLPVVVGSRADKLHCVVVAGLTEKLIIGLPGLSFLGASVNFATGDVRVCRRRRKKVGGCATARNCEELRDDHGLVRDMKLKRTELEGTAESKVVSGMEGPECGVGRKKCIKDRFQVQVKDLAGKKEVRVDDLNDVKRKKPNQKDEVVPVSGPGRKEGKVNVVSPKKEEKSMVIPDHEDDVLDDEHKGDSDSGDEKVEQCSTRSAKAGKQKHKTKQKKSRKKKGKRKR